ncbi:MAG TPA: glutamate 5-kinase [Clostridia bacterium]|nr:glutamate 5-kinase [Clostridia bacterium]
MKNHNKATNIQNQGKNALPSVANSDGISESQIRANISLARRIVVKVGTSTITHESGLINLLRLEHIVREISGIVNAGKEVAVVSSGAVGAGAPRLGLPPKPPTIFEKQAAAAVGQGVLVHMYEKLFAEYQRLVAQILITREDLDDRKRYLNVRTTLLYLLHKGVIPIINENDTVSADEIRFGDNDTLAALVAMLLEADVLVILTDTDGLYTADPRTNSEASFISFVGNTSRVTGRFQIADHHLTSHETLTGATLTSRRARELDFTLSSNTLYPLSSGAPGASEELTVNRSKGNAALKNNAPNIQNMLNIREASSGKRGTGGMRTKIAAAAICSSSGIPTVIANGATPHVLEDILTGKPRGTVFAPTATRISMKASWLASAAPRGRLVVDKGAEAAITEGGKSLLPSGLVAVSGRFTEGSVVSIVDLAGNELAKGMVNYPSSDLRRIVGLHTSQVEAVLGYKQSDEVVHRDNMVLTLRPTD